MNPKLPPLSDREIYAMSHPSSPDFESEIMQKSWFDPNYKRPTVTPVLNQGFFDMHEEFDNELLKHIKDRK